MPLLLLAVLAVVSVVVRVALRVLLWRPALTALVALGFAVGSYVSLRLAPAHGAPAAAGQARPSSHLVAPSSVAVF